MQTTTDVQKNRVHYKQIAQISGLSVATISRIFTGRAKVAEDTKDKVVKALAALGIDDGLFRIKENQRGGLLVFNIPSFGNPFYAKIMSGAKSAATQRGWQLLVNEEHINDSTIDNFILLLQKVRAAGLVTANHVPPAQLQRIAKTIPLVQCCEFDRAFDIPYVSIDDSMATRSAMEYLISLGRRNIGFVNGPIRYKYARERLQGYRESMEKSGLPMDPTLVIQLPEISYNLAVSALTNIFNTGKRPDAFFCASDILAAAVIKVCARYGLKVPKDVAVIGFDNVDISFMSSPTITTISQPEFQLGFSACELLIERVTNGEAPLHNIVLDTELIVRESSQQFTT
ncbi:MAG: substrate-binding domain-containing protein [Treponema sp.]|jgi:LacI family repressor for deo operon, udp, cdd, tsx, nupC, and nupG|nr:substrate-binding domain-containing protein [Treponema sp.]